MHLRVHGVRTGDGGPTQVWQTAREQTSQAGSWHVMFAYYIRIFTCKKPKLPYSLFGFFLFDFGVVVNVSVFF